MHPGGCEGEIIHESPSLIERESPFERSQSAWSEVFFANFAESLNQQAGEATGGSHVSGSCPAKLDGQGTNLDGAGGSLSEEDSFRGDMIGESQSVCGIGSRRLDSGTVASGKGEGDGFGGGEQHSELGVVSREIVETSCEPADDTFPGESMEGDIDGPDGFRT